MPRDLFKGQKIARQARSYKVINKPRFGGVCVFQDCRCSGSGFEFLRFKLFQLCFVVMSVALAVKHANQDVFLMNIPQVYAMGYKLVEHT